MVINKMVIAFGTAFAVALAAALGVDIHEHRQVSRKIGIASGELKTAAVKDIQQAIVEKAVKDAAEDKVADYIRSVRNEVMDEAKSRIQTEVSKAVEGARAVTEKEVLDRISQEASRIDMADLKKEARAKAEAKILEKFDGNLEDLLEKFNDNLSNVQKIYGGIADAISKTNERDKDRGLKFTIG